MAERDFEELLATINKLSAELDRIGGRVSELQKEFASGHWGTQQLKEFREEIHRLQAEFQKKELKLTNLVNERDLRASTKEFESLSKAIDTTRRQLEHLKAEQASRASGNKPFLDYSPDQLEKQIARYERALSAFHNRAFKNFTPQGTRKGVNDVDPLEHGGVGNVDDLAARIGGSRLSPAQIEDIRKKGREVAQRVLNQIQNELLQGAITSRLQPGNISEINAQQNEILRTAIRDREAINSRRDRIRGINAEYESQDTSKIPNVTTIGEPKSTLSYEEKEINRTNQNIVSRIAAEEARRGWERIFTAIGLEAQRQAAQQALSSRPHLADFINSRGIHPEGWRRDRGGSWEKIPTTETIGSNREKDRQDRLDKSMRARVASEEKYRIALEQAARQGFNINDLTRLDRRGTAGIEKLQFDRTDPSGLRQRFDTYVQPSGRATPGISNQFRSFGQGVVRDIGELTKWSIALAAVYGPLRKLQELTQIMIENQTRLAEAATSVSSSFIGQDEIFEAAAAAAERAGESVEGVIDAFTLAYRAAGGGTDEMERFATATELLDNALILSKLSTLDQATSIDTLAAAMRQTSGELTGSIELLDSWVRVTKVANVDLASLATGFAVLGDAAQAAQISTDQLNGILGAIGETGLTSGRELANTARAVVSGFQSDQAREALEGIGVAVEDTTGKARPFLEVMTELSNLRLSGALDDTAFSKLTLALGGGTRRQAVYATFIENIGRVNEIAAESAKANGDAQAALARQLDTVQTSLTQLGNAFQELAQAMGTEGGFLGIIQGIVEGMTGMVNMVTQLTSALGKATPALLAFIATSALLKYKGQGGIQQYLGNLGAGLERDPVAARYYTDPRQAPANGRGRQILQGGILGAGGGLGGVTSGAAQGLLISALPAILNATNKDDRYGGAKATADIVGGVGGGIIGSLVAGSPIVGAAVGTAISEAFVNSTIARSTDIYGYKAPEVGKPFGEQGPGTVDDLDQQLKDAEARLYEAIGFGNEGLGKILSNPGNRADTIVEDLNKAIKDGNKEAFDEILNNTDGFSTRNKEELQALGITPQLLQKAFNDRAPIEFSGEYRARQLAGQRGEEGAKALKEFDAALAARVARGGTPLNQTTPYSELVKANTEAFAPLLRQIQDQSKSGLRTDRIQGEVRGAEYGRRTEAISGFNVKALQYYTALGDEVDRIDGQANSAARAFEVLNNVIVFGAEDALPQLTALSGEIETLVNLLGNPILNEEQLSKLGGVEKAQALLQEKREDLANLIEDANKQSLLDRIQVPNLEGDINNPLTTGDLGQVEQRAKELQDEFYQGFLQIPDDMYDALKDSWEEWAQIVEDSGDVFYKTVSEIDPQFFQQAMAELIEQQKLESQQKSPFGIQQIDLGSERRDELQSLINYFSGYLSQNFPQYEQKPEDVGVIFNDYVTSVLHGDNLAMKLALEKLVDINQKQLDGMYNIPEGATFWVPLTAAYYKPKNNENGGLPAIDAQAVDGNTSATEMNTQALRDATDKWMNMDPLLWDRPQGGAGEGLSRGQQADALRLREQAERYNTDRGRAADAARYSGLASLYGYNPLGQKIGESATVHTSPGEAGYRPAAYGGSYNPSRPEMGEGSIATIFERAIANLLSGLRGMFSGTTPGQYPGYGGSAGGHAGPGIKLAEGDMGGGYRGLASQTPPAVNNPVNARLDLQFENTTQLIVDGRVLASVMSPYMAQEMVRLEASQGTISRRYVI